MSSLNPVIEEFLEELEKTAANKNWKKTYNGHIRTQDDEYPICFVDNQLAGKNKTTYAYWLTDIYNMNKKDKKRNLAFGYIATAADTTFKVIDKYLSGELKEIRFRLLQITGLKDEE